MTGTPQGLRGGATVRITAGRAEPEEVAAVVLALDAAARAAAPPAPRRPAWQRAARLEAMGGAPVASAADLRDATRR